MTELGDMHVDKMSDRELRLEVKRLREMTSPDSRYKAFYASFFLGCVWTGIVWAIVEFVR